MKLNQAGLALLKEYEGFRPTPYKDQGGKLTIGYGHLIKPGEKFTTLTQAQAVELLQKDIAVAEASLRRYLRVTLSENRYSAIVCWVFNLGEGNLAESTLLKKLNAADYDNVPEEILRWHRVSKKPSRGLIRRRAAEAILFLS